MDDEGMLAEACVPVGLGSMFGVGACWGDREDGGLASPEEVGVACPLLWAGASGGFWHAESSKHIQIKAIMLVR